MHEPNLQNIPRDFELTDGNEASVAVKIRDVFVADNDHVLLAADYCQIELRLLAHLSEDENLIMNITSDSDVFVSIASHIFNVLRCEVSLVEVF